jgi:hypothetical protein
MGYVVSPYDILSAKSSQAVALCLTVFDNTDTLYFPPLVLVFSVIINIMFSVFMYALFSSRIILYDKHKKNLLSGRSLTFALSE